MKEKFYDLLEKENVDLDDIVGEIEECFELEKQNGTIKDYKIETDCDVFESCGLDIYYVSVCWIDLTNELHIVGGSYYSY